MNSQENNNFFDISRNRSKSNIEKHPTAQVNLIVIPVPTFNPFMFRSKQTMN